MVLNLPRATVDDIEVRYTSDLAFGWFLTKVAPFIRVDVAKFSGEIHGLLLNCGGSLIWHATFKSGTLAGVALGFPHTPTYSAAEFDGRARGILD